MEKTELLTNGIISLKGKSIKKGQVRHPLSVCGSFSMAMARLLGATEKPKKKKKKSIVGNPNYLTFI